MLNIARVLKNTPVGTKLYSPIFGEVIFQGIDSDGNYPITVMVSGGDFRSFSQEGKYHCCYEDTECLLFPSKENRDWSTFKVEPQFPMTVEDCAELLDINNNIISVCGYKGDELRLLQQLLICRDAWWKVDNDWKPDWSNATEVKSTITLVSNKICIDGNYNSHRILAFRTEEIRDKFLDTFRDLIEKCKELL